MRQGSIGVYERGNFNQIPDRNIHGDDPLPNVLNIIGIGSEAELGSK